MAIELGSLFLIGVAYLSTLFAIAWLTDRNIIPSSLASHPLVYTLSLGVFACSWSFFGMTAVAGRHGYGYLGYFIGTGALFLFAPLVLLPLLRLCRRMQFTSLADLLAYRYRGGRVGAIVTLGMLAVALPLVATQIRVVSEIAALLSGTSADGPAHERLGLVFAGGVAVFAILFGTRPISDRERHSGLVVTMAFETLVKLIAFLAIGAMATASAFGSPAGLGEWLTQNPAFTESLQRATRDSSGDMLTMLFFAAATGLPHLLHMALYENPSMRAVVGASWRFPLLLLLLSLPILPVYWAGERLGLGGSAEYYAARIGLVADAPGIALAAFIGGVSAASSTIIVMSLAIASMSMNNFVLPFYRLGGGSDLYRGLAAIRSVLITLVILAAHLFSTQVAGRSSLETLGFTAILAAAQFFPGTLALLYWPRTNSAGFLAGLAAGFAVWLLAVIDPQEAGLLGAVAAALPVTITDSHWGNAAINSLGLNILVLALFSLVFGQSADEREVAASCSLDNLSGPARHALQVRTPAQFIEALKPALGEDGATREVERALRDLGFPSTESRPFAMRRLRDRIEANLSRLMGAAVAIEVVNSRLPYEARASEPTSEDIYLVDSRLDTYRRELTGFTAEVDALRRFYRNTLQELPVGVCGVNAAGEIVMWNHAIEQATGVGAASVLGSTVDALPAPWCSVLGGFLASGSSHDHLQRVERDGETAWISLHKALAPEGGPDSGTDARFVLLEDVTENQLLQEELFHSERLASIGRLAAGVAHEIGNPVTGIDCLAQNLLADSDEETVHESARQILNQTHRIGNIVTTLVNFAHQGSIAAGEPERLELAQCVDEAIYLLGLDRGGRRVRYLNGCPAGLRVMGDGQKLLQVFVNLLSNARDASPEDGEIRVGAAAAGEAVRVEVVDQGSGIAPGHLDKVFEPFFTTKAPGEGTGLGLALVYSILSDMGGGIDVESPVDAASGRGTRFILYLRAARDDVDDLANGQACG